MWLWGCAACVLLLLVAPGSFEDTNGGTNTAISNATLNETSHSTEQENNGNSSRLSPIPSTQPTSTSNTTGAPANASQPTNTTMSTTVTTQTSSTSRTTTSTTTSSATSSHLNITVTTSKIPLTSVTATSKSETVIDKKTSRFDVGSFVGGIVLTLGVLIILYIGCKTYHSRRGIQYRTIDEHDAII
ncbi:porimin isoform X1 [Anas platyrhynchos]|uniref:porimin isoform X1 n=1 Tax=Anas platyrhynchos TaxID=8839 RepID=UPI000F7CAAEB|nr:porimin isoform X1 [Anas platyrhynchos]|eukprot:XP_027323826.1 porimin isoform X1 [Anas platyrhynchos]